MINEARNMSELQTNITRPEDRWGLTPGSLLSALNVRVFRRFARHWRKLLPFRGKESILVKRIFISYSRRDQRVAKQIAHLIEKAGHRVWIDTAKIVGGQEWWNIITGEIRQSDLVILVASRESIASPFCRAEWKYALALNRHLIPVIDKDLSYDEIPDELRRRHCLHRVIKREVRHAVATLKKEELPEARPPPPRLPASKAAISSAFLDRRFRQGGEDARQDVSTMRGAERSVRRQEIH